MPSNTVVVEIARLWAPSNLRKVAPGTAVCAVVAAFAYFIDKRGLTHFEALFIPPLIITLAIGMAMQPLSSKASLKAGIEFSGRTVLRIGVALLGDRKSTRLNSSHT